MHACFGRFLQNRYTNAMLIAYPQILGAFFSFFLVTCIFKYCRSALLVQVSPLGYREATEACWGGERRPKEPRGPQRGAVRGGWHGALHTHGGSHPQRAEGWGARGGGRLAVGYFPGYGTVQGTHLEL